MNLITPVILASQSPRRKQLLEWAEVPFDIVVEPTAEDFPATMPIEQVPVFIAKNKALAVQELILKKYPSFNNRKIIAADTVVVIDNTIIGKPIDESDAVSIISKLSGRQHEVITGVVIICNHKIISFAETTKVKFHELTEEQIKFYVQKYQPFDKAGAYAIQEWVGVIGIEKIEGDFYNVMGLPVSRVVQELKKLE